MKSAMACALMLMMSLSSYAESSFNDVKQVVFGNQPLSKDAQVKNEMMVYEKGQLPHYEVSASKFVVDGVNQLFNRASATLSDKVDYYPRLEKLVHPNGICFSGVWTITASNPYSGYFQKGSKALFIGRASAALSETERGEKRGFGFAGKIFPTMNPKENVKTANFFLVDVLMGADRDRYLDVKMTNKPKLGFRVSLLKMALEVMRVFKQVDSDPSYRPVYPISELGLQKGDKAVTPVYMMLEADKSVARNDDADFRDELSIRKNHAEGLKFNILVNDVSENQDSEAWKKIGQIELDESTVSHGCDRRLHFSHPKMK